MPDDVPVPAKFPELLVVVVVVGDCAKAATETRAAMVSIASKATMITLRLLGWNQFPDPELVIDVSSHL